MAKKNHSYAFTLIEVMIAMTIFVSLATTGVIMLSNVSKASRKVEMEEYLYTEAQNVIERIARVIQSSAIDYEEYYSRYVLQNYPTITTAEYGINYGSYHQRFFNPSTDWDTFQNWYDGSGQTEDFANSVCIDSATCSTTATLHQMNELYLINRSGTLKTIFTLEYGAISIVELTGEDTDGNGLIDTWECTSDYACMPIDPSYNLPDPEDVSYDGTRDTDDFIPISSQNIEIESLQFYISPIEDPYKGEAETSESFESVQIQPKITIKMTARYRVLDNTGTEVIFGGTGDYIGEAPTLTLQTTIGTGVYSRLETHQP